MFQIMQFSFVKPVFAATLVAMLFLPGDTLAQISCQSQAGRFGAICAIGKCPFGMRSVFYHTGCSFAQKCCV